MALKTILTAAEDPQLQRRFLAAAAKAGIPDPESWIYRHRYALATAEVDDGASDISQIYEYTLSLREAAEATLPATAAENAEFMTDDRLAEAVQSVWDAQA